MKNFETLYKILMNEAEDDSELMSAEQDLNSSLGDNSSSSILTGPDVDDPASANPRNAKIKNVMNLSPRLTEIEAAKIVDADLYDIFVSQFEDLDTDIIAPDDEGLNLSPETELPTEDDIADIKEPLSIERKSRSEEDEDMWNVMDQD